MFFDAECDRPTNPYQLRVTRSRKRLTIGHFVTILAAPFYLIGFWHMYKMLEPGGGFLPLTVSLLAGYSLIIKMAWASSSAMIGSIIQLQNDLSQSTALLRAYRLYEITLLEIARFITQVMSVGFIYLVWQGKTNYPIWMAFFNPVVLLTGIALMYMAAPRVLKYFIPSAMNLAYGVFFALSIYLAMHLN